jgi:mono/diheme cytochrome c family protein
VRTQDHSLARIERLLFLLAIILGVGTLGTRPADFAPKGNAGSAAFFQPVKRLIHGGFEIPAVYAAAGQDASQAAPTSVATPSTAPSLAAPGSTANSQPRPGGLPEGDGKPIATEYCQDCHRLTNLTMAHKSPDDWLDTVQTMMDRGARLPQENVDTLVKYLAMNFPPKPDAPATDSQAAPATAATPATTVAVGSAAAAPIDTASTMPTASAAAAATAAGPVNAAPGAAVQAQKVELPEGEGKSIAVENCQACHRLTNLVKAHKSLDDWRDTVQLMMDRGANVQAEQVDTLVQYLAKNFGPAPAAAATGAPVSGAAAHPSSPSPEAGAVPSAH